MCFFIKINIYFVQFYLRKSLIFSNKILESKVHSTLDCTILIIFKRIALNNIKI